MTSWATVPEMAKILGVKIATMHGRARRISAAPYTRVNLDGELEIDVEHFTGDHARLQARSECGQFRAKSVQERVAAKREANARDDARKAGRPMPVRIDVDAANFDDLAFDDLLDDTPDFDGIPPRFPGGSFVDHLDERRKWAAKIEQIKFRKLAEEIVSREAVRMESFEVARLARDQLLAIPDRVSGLLASESNQDMVFKILDDEIRRVLTDLCDRIEKTDFDDAVKIEEPET
jgi:hypothetical protein